MIPTPSFFPILPLNIPIYIFVKGFINLKREPMPVHVCNLTVILPKDLSKKEEKHTNANVV